VGVASFVVGADELRGSLDTSLTGVRARNGMNADAAAAIIRRLSRSGRLPRIKWRNEQGAGPMPRV
jgi:hypothetical protein